MPPEGKDTYARGDAIDLIAFALILWKWKAFVAALCGIAVASALVVSVLSTPIFRSKVTILAPPEQGISMDPALQTVASQLPGMGAGMTRNQDMFFNILNSRTITERLVLRYRLVPYYRVASVQEAIDFLQEGSQVKASKEGLLSVTVEDRDPRIAAEIANAWATELEQFLSRVDVGMASRQRRFVVEQLTKTENELREAEEALMRFQDQNRAVSLSEQSRGALQFASRLKSSIVMAQVELENLRNFSTDSNPDVVRLKGRIAELKRQLAQTQYGTGLDLPNISGPGDIPGVGRKEIYLSAADVPKLALQLARLTREVKVREQLYGMLSQQLEKVKISEARDVPMVQVLDRATPADRKWKPRTLRNMLVSATLAALMGTILLFLLEFIDRTRSRAGLANST